MNTLRTSGVVVRIREALALAAGISSSNAVVQWIRDDAGHRYDVRNDIQMNDGALRRRRLNTNNNNNHHRELQTTPSSPAPQGSIILDLVFDLPMGMSVTQGAAAVEAAVQGAATNPDLTAAISTWSTATGGGQVAASLSVYAVATTAISSGSGGSTSTSGGGESGNLSKGAVGGIVAAGVVIALVGGVLALWQRRAAAARAARLTAKPFP